MRRRIPIRARIAAALAVPFLALVVGAGVGVSTSTSQASTVTRQAELTVASIGHAGLINTLQNERNTALVGMLDVGSAIELQVASVGESRDLTDTSRHALHNQIAGEDDTLREDYAEALALLDGLPAVRGRVDEALQRPGAANRETAHEIFQDYTAMVAAIFTSHDRFSLMLDQRADLLRSHAEAQRRWYAGGALAALLVAVAVAWWVSRSITRPLRDLSRQARLMAEQRLPRAVSGILATPVGHDVAVPEPDPVEINTSDEVSDVAQALNDVHRSALGLAVEQAALRRNIAESYVNLGRRNQNLLSRLIDVVGELERGETDPDRVGQIHKADHLATRIRRNAESLLVLSEADTPPRWRPPVRVLDVVRAALGEIENYQRVVLPSLDPVMIVGGAASDLTHLLAELIENGVKHSPPHELVEIRGRTTPDGYSLAVIDHGLGMTAAEITRANHRLAGEESPTVALSKYLGHFVAAALAARNGIRVRLQGSEVVGVAAIVDLPPTAVAGPGEPIPALAAAPVAAAAAAAAWTQPWAVPLDAPAAEAGYAPVAPVEPGDAIPAGPAVPAVTASGLARRVRGAQQPGVHGTFMPAPRLATDDTPVVDGAPPPVDAAAIQRFLTSLAAGVQRSLADTGRGPTGPEER